MSWAYRTLVRPILFTQDPEAIHEFTMRWLGRIARHRAATRLFSAFFGSPELPVRAFGLTFPNPVGLAAGMDKQATAVPIWPAMGFGFSELGAVTWHAQPGNPRPRIFRAAADLAIINRMGFNNDGAPAFAQALAAWRSARRWPAHPVGVNLGKSKVTPLEQAADDYARSLRQLWPHVDFFVVNVSSPNTPNLRQLQDKAALSTILNALQQVNGECARQATTLVDGRASGPKPILVKVAPDLSLPALDEIVELVQPCKIAGLVATNTTITRPEPGNEQLRRVYGEAGGLSGVPLRDKSTEVIRHLYRQTRGKTPIIGVGGIFTADDAWAKVAAGATLLQIYTGLVFEGPGAAWRIVRGLRRRLAAEGFRQWTDAVGCAAKA